ncbi:alcohol dehydrogenase catalytic domain-containing protein [Halostella sp. JP-L12]|uniref:alcohol dehydrogenase catalytic domain-containing protein n=1 Tax=Halostella TaxID=1843185 RepID=UPI000EF828E2|nr:MULTISPECIES: alcohol dehydrogenase catalytic domain-containing protein [Halostella]NHN47355.1 alcohol dehydrogenase catalytic domain-containing protein [Halostella sp. JP-L12]
MRAAVVPEPDGDLEVRERAIPQPEPGEVRIAVAACGICGGDDVAREGAPPVEYPRVPGHEIVGTVDAVGGDVTEWDEGDRVGVGWHGGHCFDCDACRRGEFVHCENGVVTGLHRDGGYAEYALARREALAAVPDELDDAAAAPLLCAGLTTFNALRHSDACPGDLVAVVGIGGLGHLGVQYAHRAGFETVAVSRGAEKRAAALDLGADHYVDSEAVDPGAALRDLGGARVALVTAPSSDAVASVVDGLGADGEVLVVGSPEDPVPVDATQLVGTRGRVAGWASGTPSEAEDALAFSDLRDVVPAVETFDLADAAEAYRQMSEGEVRFRAVLVP